MVQLHSSDAMSTLVTVFVLVIQQNVRYIVLATALFKYLISCTWKCLMHFNSIIHFCHTTNLKYFFFNFFPRSTHRAPSTLNWVSSPGVAYRTMATNHEPPPAPPPLDKATGHVQDRNLCEMFSSQRTPISEPDWNRYSDLSVWIGRDAGVWHGLTCHVSRFARLWLRVCLRTWVMSDGLIKTVLRLWDSVVTDWADGTDGANKKNRYFCWWSVACWNTG